MNAIAIVNPVEPPTQLPEVDDHTCVSTDLNANDEAIQLWVRQHEENEVFKYDERAGARFPKSETDIVLNAKLTLTNQSSTREIDLSEMKSAFPRINTFRNGEILVASARCHRWKDGSVELNAKLFDTNVLRAEFCLGDGIQHLQIDPADRIWVGYFDEGVYGNRGWGHSADAPPIGASGLVCFDRAGRKLWEYTPPQGFDFISDCYALNCADDAIWTCCYTDFPIIRIDSEFQIRAWHTDLFGPRQMAVKGDRLLVYGGYRDKASDCWLLKLGDSTAERIAQVQLCLPANVSRDKATVIGRGRFLHVFADSVWYRFEVPRN